MDAGRQHQRRAKQGAARAIELGALPVEAKWSSAEVATGIGEHWAPLRRRDDEGEVLPHAEAWQRPQRWSGPARYVCLVPRRTIRARRSGSNSPAAGYLPAEPSLLRRVSRARRAQVRSRRGVRQRTVPCTGASQCAWLIRARRYPDAGTGERGQAAPLMLVVVVVAGLLVIGIGRLGGAVIERARAQTAADAAALAGAAEGRVGAERLARANGGRLVSFAVGVAVTPASGTDIEVVVVVGGAQATARARRTGGPPDAFGAPGPRRTHWWRERVGCCGPRFRGW